MTRRCRHDPVMITFPRVRTLCKTAELLDRFRCARAILVEGYISVPIANSMRKRSGGPSIPVGRL